MNGITYQNQTTIYISNPDNISYAEGTTGHYIEWYVSFDAPLHYSIQRNNSAFQMPSGDLESNSGNITISVDGLSVGTWNYLLIVDDYGNTIETDLVVVTVYPSSIPILKNPLFLPVILLVSIIVAIFAWNEMRT
jgi:hypothetical protein